MSDNLKFSSDKKRLLLLTDGNIDHASARIRAIHYIPMLEKAGFEVCFIPRTGKKPPDVIFRYIVFPPVKRYLWIKKMYALYFKSWDIIFIQRSFLPEYVLRMLKKKTPVIFDFDDAIYISDQGPSNKKRSEIMIKYADEIIISTEYLNEFCGLLNKKGTVIPSPVETDRIKPAIKQPREKPVIGWIGSLTTTQNLMAAVTALQKLYKEVPFKFITMGAKPDYRISNINHISKPWSFEEENTFLSEIDIGIMPLPDYDFQRAKGGYKLYLYMAAGIPCVASPVGVNRSIIRNGENGFLANSEEEWIETLKKLITEPHLRQKLGQTGRNDAIKYYERSVCFEKLLDVLHRLI
jgi:glycosyltransferase involved in cell wall biosynthesis